MSEYIFTALISVFTSIATWFAARRKNLAETTSSELDNAEKAVKYYREMVDDIAARYKMAVQELDDLKNHYKEQEKQLQALLTENRNLVEELKNYKQLNGKQP